MAGAGDLAGQTFAGSKRVQSDPPAATRVGYRSAGHPWPTSLPHSLRYTIRGPLANEARRRASRPAGRVGAALAIVRLALQLVTRRELHSAPSAERN
jgi:hypothetical protein